MPFSINETAAPASHRSFTVTYDGTTISVTLANTAAAVARWISETESLQVQFPGKFIVGLGVQWTPGYRAPADTLQLCVGKRCLVYQLRHRGNVPSSLRRFLLDPGNTFVGFWNQRDRRKLEISPRGLKMFRNPLDLRKYVQAIDGGSLRTATMDRILEEYFGISGGVPINRETSMSNWRRKSLSHEQILQVTLDAHFAFIMGKNIGAWALN